MRLNWDDHLPLRRKKKVDEIAMKYKVISGLLDEHPEISQMAVKDLCAGKKSGAGRNGMTGDQAIRTAVLYRMLGVSYKVLHFHIFDSDTFRSFCHMPFDAEIGVSTIAENVKAIRPETWEAIHELLVVAGKKKLISRRIAKSFESTALASQPTFTDRPILPFFEIASAFSLVKQKK